MDQNQQPNTGMPQGGQSMPGGSTPPTSPTPSTPSSSPTPQTPPPSPMPGVPSGGGPVKPSFPSGNPFTPDQSGSTPEKESAIPSPPSPQEKVGIRTMSSDMESIKQSGGQPPKSDIVSAPEISRTSSDASPVSTTPKDISAPKATGAMSGNTPQPPPSDDSGESSMPSPQPEKSFSLKTMLIILGIIVAAAIVGYGVYYLVTSLSSSPSIPTLQQTTPAEQLPIGSSQQESTTTTTTPETPISDTSKTSAIVHQSIVTFDASASSTLLAADLTGMRSAVTTSATPVMNDGQSREVMMNVAGAQQDVSPISTKQFLEAYLPSLSDAASLFSPDLTTWLYFDGTPTVAPKFGVALMLDDTTSLAQASSTIAVVEQHPDEIANLFASQITAPSTPEFNDGTIGSVSVRFMIFSSGNVFEYGWATYNGHTYLLMTTSYPQMKDIVSRLSLN